MSANYQPGTAVKLQRTVHDRFGELKNADSLPVGTLIRNGTDSAESVSVTNLSAGRYRFEFTIPGSWSVQDTVELRVNATVDGVPGGSIVWSVALHQLIIVGPLSVSAQVSLNIPFPVTISVFKKASATLTITVIDGNGSVINLAGKTLKFVVESSADDPVVLFTVTAGITISGASSEIASVPISVVNSTQTPGKYKWRLWDDTTDIVLAHGDFVILPSSGG